MEDFLRLQLESASLSGVFCKQQLREICKMLPCIRQTENCYFYMLRYFLCNYFVHAK